MIKQLILLLMMLALLLLPAGENQIVQVMVILPLELVPYYEWVLNFPGWQQLQNEPSNMQPTGLQACNTSSRSDHSAVKPR
jgi:hypothetical protein